MFPSWSATCRTRSDVGSPLRTTEGWSICSSAPTGRVTGAVDPWGWDCGTRPRTTTRGCRRWRTSHTGGHRFAPTALILPHGQYWAYLDERSLLSILDRSCHPAELAWQYRGSAACRSGAEQVAEREAFVRNGWEWLGWRRSTEDLGGGRVHIRFESPSGRSGTYEVDTEVARSVPVPRCGQPAETWEEEATELRVTGFRQV